MMLQVWNKELSSVNRFAYSNVKYLQSLPWDPEECFSPEKGYSGFLLHTGFTGIISFPLCFQTCIRDIKHFIVVALSACNVLLR